MIITFSPDGGTTVYALSPSVVTAKIALAVIGGLLLALSFVLMQLLQAAASAVNFILTVQPAQAIRLLVFFILVVLITLAFILIRRLLRRKGVMA